MFGKVLLIKLRLNELKNIGRIYYQYAHEFTHAMFYCELGIDKKLQIQKRRQFVQLRLFYL